MDALKVILRRATRHDVLTVLRLLDAGAAPDVAPVAVPTGVSQAQWDAFERIDRDTNACLMVAEIEGTIVGTFQINFLTYLGAKGKEDAQIESVHVAPEYRSQGIGEIMMKWAISKAKERQCRRIQLTTNKSRKDAHRFYERIGFVATHEGMKLSL